MPVLCRCVHAMSAADRIFLCRSFDSAYVRRAQISFAPRPCRVRDCRPFAFEAEISLGSYCKSCKKRFRFGCAFGVMTSNQPPFAANFGFLTAIFWVSAPFPFRFRTVWNLKISLPQSPSVAYKIASVAVFAACHAVYELHELPRHAYGNLHAFMPFIWIGFFAHSFPFLEL